MIPVADLYPGQWITTTPNGPPHQVRSVRPGTTFTTLVQFADALEPVTYGPGAMLYPAAAPERVCIECGEPVRDGSPAHQRRCTPCAVAKYVG